MVDPVTLEVLRNAFAAVAEEMNATLVRTAYSPNITDRRDCSCAVFDLVDGAPEMVGQAENIPVHLGAMPASVSAALERFPVDDLAPGDAVVLNDPYHGGAHLPDLTLVSPVFVDGRPVMVAANRAHHADVGGLSAGSIAADATEIYHEGLRIPPVKLYEAGEPVGAVFDLLEANVRTPEERRGDLRAQHAANQTARGRMAEVVERHGLGTVVDAATAVKDYAERRMRAEIGSLPDGSAAFEDVLDDDGRGHEDVAIAVRLDIEGDVARVDFAGTDPQVEGAVNAPLPVTTSATYFALRCLTDPTIPPNRGCYRPIEIAAPPGSVVNAEPPAAVAGGNLEVSQRVADVVMGAFGELVPGRAVAAGQGTMNNVTLGGFDRRDADGAGGRAYAFYETEAGGFGARPGRDGLDAVHVHMSNTRNTPVEVLETAYPLRVRRYALRPDSGGAGEYRGGLGLHREIEAREPADLSLLADRRTHAPYGVGGGMAGAPGEDRLVADGDGRRIASKTRLRLEPGEAVSIRTPGGGGLGDPADRERAAIAADLRSGKLTPGAARADYGLSAGDVEALLGDDPG